MTHCHGQLLRGKFQITYRNRDRGIQDGPSTTIAFVGKHVHAVSEGQIPLGGPINGIQRRNRYERRTLTRKYIVRNVKPIIGVVIVPRISQNIVIEIRRIEIIKHFDNTVGIRPKEPVKSTCNAARIHHCEIDGVISKRKLGNNTIPSRPVIRRFPHAIIINGRIEVLSAIIAGNRIDGSIC